MNIEHNIELLRKSVLKRANDSGRDFNEITIMAVTKNHPVDVVLQAVSAGIDCFGENRVQEAAAKYQNLTERINLHLIGHLQSNKVAKAVRLFNWIDSVDSIKLLRKINQAAEKSGKIMQILFEVNVSGESSKYGFTSEEDVFSAIEVSQDLHFINPRGFMTIGPLSSHENLVRDAFRSLKKIFEQAKFSYKELQLDVLSMGMSGDWKIAVEEGSTLIRVGTSIFGKRQMLL